MTPNQAWRGLTSIPIELLWGIEALIKSESDKAVEAFAAELKGETERIYCEEGFIEGVTTETIDQALIERTKHE